MNAEWGYFLLSELDNTNVEGVEVERDLLWQPKKFSEISQKGIGVVHEYFTEQEAQAKIGKVIETLVEFSSVPKGTGGTVVRADHGMAKARWTVGIQWLLAPPKPSISLAQIGNEQLIAVDTGKPLIDWFTKAEYEKYLKEL